MIGARCPTCTRYRGDMTCAAFPEEIPTEIATGEFDHKNPHPDDQGIQWDPEEGWEE